MEGTELLNKLLQENKPIRENEACRDNVLMLGQSLLYSFGLDMDDPTKKSDLDRGYANATRFLNKVCTVFKDPTHIVRVAPFAHAYLGTKMFNKVLQKVLDRAQQKPEEQTVLDEVFTAATLLKPDLRERFLETVTDAATLDDKLLGLDFLVSSADPSLAFSSSAEFPHQFQTSDVRKATDLLGAFIEMGLVAPGTEFTPEYLKINRSMGGFEYLLQQPSPDHIILVADRKQGRLYQEMRIGSIENTDALDARPNNTGKNPLIVLLNSTVSPANVKRLYRDSTVVYVAHTTKEKKSMINVLGEERQLLIDLSDRLTADERADLVRAHVNFIRSKRQEYGLKDLTDLLAKEIKKAERLLQERNESFYDARDEFETLGRRNLIDELVKKGGYKLPVRTDETLILAYSEKKRDIAPLFEGTTRKKVNHYSELPLIDETGRPFVIVTDKAVPLRDITEKFPATPVIYLAKDSHQEAEMLRTNPNGRAFVINAKNVENTFGRYDREDHRYLGQWIAQAYFARIATNRGRGVTDMQEIGKQISGDVKKVRDEILFSTAMHRRYMTVASEYYQLQETFKATPLMLQLTDGVLMETCPTGGCFNMTRPSEGGCCGGGNLPEVLIDFAIAYRKQVGEERFMKELNTFHEGKAKEPWYMDSRRYKMHFNGLGKAPVEDDMVF